MTTQTSADLPVKPRVLIADDSRLDILSRLVGTQREFERSLEILVRNMTAGPQMPILSRTAACPLLLAAVWSR